MNKQIVIIGAGIGGLSLGYFLKKKGIEDFVILEKGNEVGGLCRSFRFGDDVWDRSVHILHSATQDEADFIEVELDVPLIKQDRKATVRFSYDDAAYIIPFPFQSNIDKIPNKYLIRKCEDIITHNKIAKTYKEWLLNKFGETQCKCFFYPHATKLWGKENFESMVPEEMLSKVPNSGSQGYNPYFYYPEAGGIDNLPKGFYKSIKDKVILNYNVSDIDINNKIISSDNTTSKIYYDSLYSYMPLYELVKCSRNIDSTYNIKLNELSKKLKYIGLTFVTNIYSFPDKSMFEDINWYYDSTDTPLIRRIFQHSFCDNNSKKDYIVTSEIKDKKDIWAVSTICDNEKKVLTHIDESECAYSIFDADSYSISDEIRNILADDDIHSYGRYGKWRYMCMIEGIRESKQLAEEILNER